MDFTDPADEIWPPQDGSSPRISPSRHKSEVFSFSYGKLLLDERDRHPRR